MPAKAGIQRTSCASGAYWIPACAGMTSLGNRPSQARLVEASPRYNAAVIAAVLCLIPASFALAWPVTWWVRRLGLRLGQLDSPGSAGHQKVELRRIPNIGGIAILAALLGPLVVGLALLRLIPEEALTGFVPAIEPHLPGIAQRTPMAIALGLSLLAMHVMGLIDDRRPLGPRVKLGVQFALAALVVLSPFDLAQSSRLLTVLDDAPGLAAMAPWPSIILTILWLVVVTNAINFMDNMDGLAGGVSCIAASLFLAAALLNGQWFIAALLALLVGALLGFLCFNFPPASIFMGDGGSLVVGFLLGFLTIRTTYIDPGAARAWYGVFMPLIVLAVPLYDLVSVVTIRLRQGRSPMVGDQQHFSHRLMQRGLNARAMLAVVYGITLATGLTGIFLGRLTEGWMAALAGTQVVVMLIVLAVYERAIGAAAARNGAADGIRNGERP